MADLIAAGVEITLIGMGTVFALLVLLVYVMQGMSKAAHLLGGNPSDVAAAADPADARVTAAITAAIHAWRARHGRGP